MSIHLSVCLSLYQSIFDLVVSYLTLVYQLLCCLSFALSFLIHLSVSAFSLALALSPSFAVFSSLTRPRHPPPPYLLPSSSHLGRPGGSSSLPISRMAVRRDGSRAISNEEFMSFSNVWLSIFSLFSRPTAGSWQQRRGRMRSQGSGKRDRMKIDFSREEGLRIYELLAETSLHKTCPT